MSEKQFPMSEQYTRANERFWPRLMQSGDCWLWTGTLLDGYGQFYTVGVKRKGIAAHRFAYLTLVGDIPEGLELDHLCRTRACVNPYHMDPVTHKENMRRSPSMGAGNRSKQICKRGHPFTPENTSVAKQSYGRGVGRVCLTCARERAAAYRRAVA